MLCLCEVPARVHEMINGRRSGRITTLGRSASRENVSERFGFLLVLSGRIVRVVPEPSVATLMQGQDKSSRLEPRRVFEPPWDLQSAPGAAGNLGCGKPFSASNDNFAYCDRLLFGT